MTQHLALWKADADAKGIPENIQRGLAFFIGINIAVNGIPFDEDQMPVVLARLHPSLPNIPDEVGGQFDDQTIAGLLRELAGKMDPEFSPRVITHDDATFAAIPSLPEERLPAMEGVDLRSLAFLTEIAKSLFGQIGDCIHDETVEGWVLSGIIFFTAYSQVDADNTVAMCSMAMSVLPPHMQFSFICFLLPLDSVRLNDGPLDQTLDAFYAGRTESTRQLVGEFLENYRFLEYYADPTYLERRGSFDYLRNFQKFSNEALVIARALVQLPMYGEWVDECAEELRAESYQKTYADETVAGRYELIEDMEGCWGYRDLATTASTLYLGELMDRAACVLQACLRDAVLERDRRAELPLDEPSQNAMGRLIYHFNFVEANPGLME